VKPFGDVNSYCEIYFKLNSFLGPRWAAAQVERIKANGCTEQIKKIKAGRYEVQISYEPTKRTSSVIKPELVKTNFKWVGQCEKHSLSPRKLDCWQLQGPLKVLRTRLPINT